jgi:CheY-like chemotaxis protein
LAGKLHLNKVENSLKRKKLSWQKNCITSRVRRGKIGSQTISAKQEKEAKEMKPILIVEDEAILRESLRDWLREEGYEVETAEEGEEALQKIGEKEFGVAVLDLRLPGRNGLEVLKKATAQTPKLKGIIITAYPSVETAVEAMKVGAVDYMVKPFNPDALEKSIQEVLGPVQVKIKPQETNVETAMTKAPVIEEGELEEIIAISEQEVPIHLERGKAYFNAGHYREALKEFLSILRIAPGHMETRVWIRRAKEELAKPSIEAPQAGVGIEEVSKTNQCVWAKVGVVSYRFCLKNYDCHNCEFDQMMQDKIAAGQAPELEEALERLRELPKIREVCRYALKDNAFNRLRAPLFQCATCEFDRLMQDALEQRLAKLATRREALREKK